ncbi:hypothetical protein EYF80_040053 [Liparis tanakae]|uniref:Uncharacterized protein n=1 Tax=Liparis tanakae TaxID=230148 RepID=A0A4Z2G8Y4_9TELE|nr:hypothetical protein EYF80_040053 [Liparis tanakae]
MKIKCLGVTKETCSVPSIAAAESTAPSSVWVSGRSSTFPAFFILSVLFLSTVPFFCLRLRDTSKRETKHLVTIAELEARQAAPHELGLAPASWRSSPRASSMRHASRQHWTAVSFFFPVWVASATSCRPAASSTGSLPET